MATILDRITATKRIEIERAQALKPLGELEKELARALPVRGFAERLGLPGIRVIAEVKKASPSAGVIRADFDALGVATVYEANGADCISVLTDEEYFQGHLSYLTAIRHALQTPVLRKEFIIDEYQLVEARVAGADAVLLIAEILPGQRLRELYESAASLGMDVLIELHDAEELPRVLATGTRLVGINNRDLRTFTTRLEHTIDLLPKIPTDRIVVAESGIKTHADLKRLEASGAKAVLVGESLMREPDIGAALRRLRGLE